MRSTIIILCLVTSVCYAQKIAIKVTDSLTNLPTPVRVRITNDEKVVPLLPKSAVAVMYGVWDHADGYGFQPDSSFYITGSFEIDVPNGNYVISLSKGIEYISQRHNISVTSNAIVEKNYTMRRWIDMPSRGWFSADDHIHIRRSPREDSLLIKWLKAEDIHVGVMLKMGDFWATYFDQYAWGVKGVYREGDHMISPGQEDPRTPELGHTIGIGASKPVRYQSEYYYYDKVFDKLHELGGVGGYAHQAESFHGYRGLVLDGLRGKVDMMEILQFCVSEDPLQVRHYYHLLNLGYAITAVAGSDFPWCKSNIGRVRFYCYVDQAFSYDSWKTSLKQGHTFVSSGPMIELKVNGKIPGDTLHIRKGATITIEAKAFGDSKQVPLQKLEIVAHGEVIQTQTSQSTTMITINKKIKANTGFWIALRAFAGPGQAAHTTPVYVSVDNGGFHNPATMSRDLELANQYLDELSGELQNVNSDPERQAWRYRDGIEKRIKSTREIIEELKRKK